MRRKRRGCGCLPIILTMLLVIAGFAGYIYMTTSNINVDDLEQIKNEQYYVPANQMPDYLKNAFIAVEDKRFYEHDGVDYFGTLRAIMVSVKNNEASQGGSTITQQLVKTYFFNNEKSIIRKVKEVVIAKKVENRFSKDEILSDYLSTIYFGDNIYNVEQAANHYFGTSVNLNNGLPKVTVLQSAILASAINAPSIYHIDNFYNDEPLKSRTRGTLKKMFEQKMITEAQYQEALASF